MTTGIFYGSNSGNTLLVAEHVAEALQRHGHEVTLRDAAHAQPAELHNHDLSILGSCTWLRDGLDGQLPEQMFEFAGRLAGHGRFPGKPFAVFALGRHEYSHFCRAADELEALVEGLQGRLVTETLRLDGFPHHQLKTVEVWAEQLAADLITEHVSAT